MLDEVAKALELCNKCGFCQAGCPVYKATGIEWMVARGRIALIKDALEGRLAMDEELREPLFSCLTCNGCLDQCPSGVPTADIVTAARHELLRERGQPWVQKLLFNGVLSNPSALATVARAAHLGQSAGLAALVQRTRVSGGLADAVEISPPIPSQSGTEALQSVLRPIESPKYKVAYFAGCAANNMFPAVAVATVRVLQRHQVEVVVPRFVCCGKPAETYGDVAAARAMARKNLDALAETGVDAVVTACGTCSSYLKRYGKLLSGAGRQLMVEDDDRPPGHLPEEEDTIQKVKEFVYKVRDVGEFLLEIGLDPRMGEVRKNVGDSTEMRGGVRVTWHDPCHLGRYQGLGAVPRQILKSVPGVDFVELPEANVCCGGAGLYGATHREIATKILDRKMDNVERTGAGILATSCPSCMVQLSYGLRRRGLPVQALELVQLLDQAYQAADT